MTKRKAISLLSQMFLIQFNKEEHEALAMAIDALNKDESQIDDPCKNCKREGKDICWDCTIKFRN